MKLWLDHELIGDTTEVRINPGDVVFGELPSDIVIESASIVLEDGTLLEIDI